MHFEKFLKDFGDQLLKSLEVNFFAKIITFYPDKMQADIRPLLENITEEDNSQIPDLKNIPVEFLNAGKFFIKPHYEKDDLVSVKCFASDIQNPIEGRRANRAIDRFSFSNCIISHGVVKKPPLLFFEKTGLLIGTIDNYIWFDAGKLKIKGGLFVDGGIEADDLTVTGDAIIGGISFLNHMHSINVPSTPFVGLSGGPV